MTARRIAVATATSLLAVFGLGSTLFAPLEASAEPYLAVVSGLKCANCHVNPTGGGKRNAFGNAWARTQLPARIVETGLDREWTGEINDIIGVGGDLRADYAYTDVSGGADQSSFGVSRGTFYADVHPIPGLLSFYVDEQFAPGASLNREAYALLTPAHGKYTVKAGQFFLPYGLRLQDDSAFIRQATGINFQTPDSGIELGLELPRWSAQLSVTNGTAGAADNDMGKQLSLNAAYVRPGWRIGGSVNANDSALGDRDMWSAYAGLRTGPIAWLAEMDFIRDQTVAGNLDMRASLLEGNWRPAKGQNLKLTYEVLDPDDDVGDNERQRWSLVWEYAPIQFLQSRIGVRAYADDSPSSGSDRDELFAEVHVYF